MKLRLFKFGTSSRPSHLLQLADAESGGDLRGNVQKCDAVGVEKSRGGRNYGHDSEILADASIRYGPTPCVGQASGSCAKVH